MKTKAEAQAEVEALNRFKNKTSQTCGFCGGSKYKYAPMHGDPNLGYTAIGYCDHCRGKGWESLRPGE